MKRPKKDLRTSQRTENATRNRILRVIRQSVARIPRNQLFDFQDALEAFLAKWAPPEADSVGGASTPTEKGLST